MRSRVLASASILAWAMSLGAQSAQAARVARVLAETIEIYADPDRTSAALGTVAKDDPLAVSNEPFAGFYKVRTSDGKVGWVPAEALNLAPADAAAAGGPAPAGGGVAAGKSAASATVEGSDGRDRGIEGGFRAMVFGGGGAFVPTTVNTVLGISGYRTAFEFGVEAAVDFNDWLALDLRAEYLTGNFVVTDTESLSSYNLGAQAVPLTLGLDWSPVRSSRFRLGIMAGAGVSPITMLYSQALGETGSNVTVYSGLGPTALGKVTAELPLSRGMSLFFEGGYRWLVTSAMSASVTANGSEIFQDPDTGEMRALDLDYSGPVGNAGLVFRF